MNSLPYGRQSIDESDIAAVVDVLRSDWLTTGPMVSRFEQALADACGAEEAVAVCNGTAALHAAMHAAGIGPGDEVLVPAMTFAATANAAVFCGGTPVFVDVDSSSLLIDAEDAESKISPRTKAIVGVDYAGHPCDWPRLRKLADQHGLIAIADACHALGASLDGVNVGALANLSAFSFHPVKPITTGEGGAVSTNDPALASRMRVFRNHGITTDHRQREQAGQWRYEMVELGYNYRLTDLQCALGLRQLQKLNVWVQRRNVIASAYDAAFAGSDAIMPLRVRPGVRHGRHLYVVRVCGDRGHIFGELRRRGIGVNVHYLPVHLHPFYQNRFGTRPGQCPVAEAQYEKILSLPIFPAMTDADVERVVAELQQVVESAAN